MFNFLLRKTSINRQVYDVFLNKKLNTPFANVVVGGFGLCPRFIHSWFPEAGEFMEGFRGAG